jgi:hypothetical protein
LVGSSSQAIEPAISTPPVTNQLIAKVSIVHKVRQLTAFRIDLACVSAPLPVRPPPGRQCCIRLPSQIP